MTCEHCGEEKDDVQERPDPYDAEIDDDYTLHRLCDQCCEELSDDI